VQLEGVSGKRLHVLQVAFGASGFCERLARCIHAFACAGLRHTSLVSNSFAPRPPGRVPACLLDGCGANEVKCANESRERAV